MAMSPRLLQQFLAIAELGSLTAAAATIGISQPALTKSIRQLEHELGVQLFQRRPRGMALTPFGEILRRRARLMELEYRYAMTEIEALKGGHAGTLRIGAGPVWSLSYLPPAIVRLHERFPNARIELQVGSGSMLIPALCEGEIDIYAGGLRDHTAHDLDLVQEELAIIEHAVVTRTDHPLTALDEVTPAAMSVFPWILFPLDFESRQRLHAYFERVGLAPPRVVAETRSYATGMALARQGDYLALLARPLVEEAAAHDLVALPIAGTIDRFPSGVTYRRSAAALPIAKALLATLRALVAERQRAPASALPRSEHLVEEAHGIA
jgi:DNA-binding transcriptional LysR family regulator